MHRHSATVVGVLTVVGLLTGCAAAGPSARDVPTVATGSRSDAVSGSPAPWLVQTGDLHGWDSVRSDLDGNGLVVAFLGGACDLPARATAGDAAAGAAEVHVSLHVSQSPGPPGGGCPSIGISRDAHITLSEPLGHRPVVDDASGKTHLPFDGRLLRMPTRLPPGLELRFESGVSSDGTQSDQQWSRLWVAPEHPGPKAMHCDATAPVGIRIVQASDATLPMTPDDVTGDGTTPVGSGTATVRRQPQTGNLFLTWHDLSGRGVLVSSLVDCEGQTPYSVQQMTDIADSLR